MKYKSIIKPILLVVAIFNCSLAHAHEKSAPAAHQASPDIYEVLLENDEVLVLKMVLQPGQADKWHEHKAETVYFEQGGSAQITTDVGEVLALDIPDGFVMWHEQWRHQVTNTGETAITAIIVDHHAKVDPLILWSWQPGAGREPAPGSNRDFLKALDIWISAKAPCPIK